VQFVVGGRSSYTGRTLLVGKTPLHSTNYISLVADE